MSKKKDKLKHVLKQALRAQDAGYSQEEINNYILDSGYKTLEDFNNAVVNRASIGLRKRHPKTEAGAVRGYIREVASGLTLGISNLGEALINSIVNNTPYEFEKELLETERSEYQEASPVLSTVGMLGGAGTTGAGAVKGAYKMFPKLAPTTGAPVMNLAKETALELPLGMAEGGISAATSGEGEVFTGTALGGGVGIAAPLVGRALSPVMELTGKGINRIRGKAPAISAAEERAVQKVDEAFTDDEMTQADRLAKLKEFEDAGMGDEVRLGYLGKSNVRQLSKDLINAPGPAKTQVKEGLLSDLRMDRARTQVAMQKGLGFKKKGAAEQIKFFEDSMAGEAAPFYKEAFDIDPIVGNARIDQIMGLPEFRKAYKEAQKTNLHAVEPQYMPDLPENAGDPGEWTMYALDQVKKMIDLKVKLPPSRANAPNKLMAKNLTENKNVLLTEMDNYSDSYRAARKIWKGGADNKDAYKKGMDAYKTSKSADDVKMEFEALESEAEKEMYRLGASTEAVTKMDIAAAETKAHSKAMRSPNALKKHEVLFGNPAEAEKFVTRLDLLSEVHQAAGEMMPRSDTASNMMRFVNGAMDIIRGGGSLTQRATARGGQLAGEKILKERARATNRELGKMLSTPGAGHSRGVLGKTDALERQLQDKMIRRGLLSGAITAGGASMLGGGSLLQ